MIDIIFIIESNFLSNFYICSFLKRNFSTILSFREKNYSTEIELNCS